MRLAFQTSALILIGVLASPSEARQDLADHFVISSAEMDACVRSLDLEGQRRDEAYVAFNEYRWQAEGLRTAFEESTTWFNEGPGDWSNAYIATIPMDTAIDDLDFNTIAGWRVAQCRDATRQALIRSEDALFQRLEALAPPQAGHLAEMRRRLHRQHLLSYPTWFPNSLGVHCDVVAVVAPIRDSLNEPALAVLDDYERRLDELLLQRAGWLYSVRPMRERAAQRMRGSPKTLNDRLTYTRFAWLWLTARIAALHHDTVDRLAASIDDPDRHAQMLDLVLRRIVPQFWWSDLPESLLTREGLTAEGREGVRALLAAHAVRRRHAAREIWEASLAFHDPDVLWDYAAAQVALGDKTPNLPPTNPLDEQIAEIVARFEMRAQQASDGLAALTGLAAREIRGDLEARVLASLPEMDDTGRGGAASDVAAFLRPTVPDEVFNRFASGVGDPEVGEVLLVLRDDLLKTYAQRTAPIRKEWERREALRTLKQQTIDWSTNRSIQDMAWPTPRSQTYERWVFDRDDIEREFIEGVGALLAEPLATEWHEVAASLERDYILATEGDRYLNRFRELDELIQRFVDEVSEDNNQFTTAARSFLLEWTQRLRAMRREALRAGRQVAEIEEREGEVAANRMRWKIYEPVFAMRPKVWEFARTVGPALTVHLDGGLQPRFADSVNRMIHSEVFHPGPAELALDALGEHRGLSSDAAAAVHAIGDSFEASLMTLRRQWIAEWEARQRESEEKAAQRAEEYRRWINEVRPQPDYVFHRPDPIRFQIYTLQHETCRTLDEVLRTEGPESIPRFVRVLVHDLWQEGALPEHSGPR